MFVKYPSIIPNLNLQDIFCLNLMSLGQYSSIAASVSWSQNTAPSVPLSCMKSSKEDGALKLTRFFDVFHMYSHIKSNCSYQHLHSTIWPWKFWEHILPFGFSCSTMEHRNRTKLSTNIWDMGTKIVPNICDNINSSTINNYFGTWYRQILNKTNILTKHFQLPICYFYIWIERFGWI